MGCGRILNARAKLDGSKHQWRTPDASAMRQAKTQLRKKIVWSNRPSRSAQFYGAEMEVLSPSLSMHRNTNRSAPKFALDSRRAFIHDVSLPSRRRRRRSSSGCWALVGFQRRHRQRGRLGRAAWRLRSVRGGWLPTLPGLHTRYEDVSASDHRDEPTLWRYLYPRTLCECHRLRFLWHGKRW